MKLILFFFLLITLIDAHQLRENYLTIHHNEDSQELNISLEIETRLFENTLIDDNNNGIISYKELQHNQEIFFNYTKSHFKFYDEKKLLSLNGATIVFHRYQDQTYLQINKIFQNINLNTLTLHYSMFFELEKNHKLLLHLDENRGDYVLHNTEQKYAFSNYKITNYQRLYTFLKTGVTHILDGLDHLLFIFMIILPSLYREINISFMEIFKIITTFSLAHSLTLLLSALGLFSPNIIFIESSIALSIFIVAFMNYFGEYKHINKKIVFIFGLLHGFGFATVLQIVKIDSTFSFLVALFGFNLGVEVGQFFVIILILPVLYLVSKFNYTLVFIKMIAFASMLISGFWFFQRIGLF
jgi:hypothetical protein